MRDYTNRSRRFTRIFYGNLQSKGYGGSRTYNAVRTGQPVCFFKGMFCAVYIFRSSTHRANWYVSSKAAFLMLPWIYVKTAKHTASGSVWSFLKKNKKQFYIPEGFAHGFLVLSDTAEFCYKCTDFYHPNDEGGLAWNDPEIGIVWPKLIGSYNRHPVPETATVDDGTKLLLSDKDQLWKGLKDTFHFA